MSKPPPFAASREHAGKVGEEGQMDQDPAPKGADDHSAGNLTKASGSSLTLAHPYSTRRPSAASIYSNSSGRRSSHGRQRSPYRNPASPPTTPLGTKSSRSKILASSAVASVEGSRWPSGDLPSPNSSIQSHRDSPSSAASDHQPQIPNESTTRASGPRPSSKASTRGRRVASAGDADPISRALPEEEVPPVPSLRPQRVQGLASSRPSSPLSVEATSPLASAGSRWIPTASASMFDLAHSKARLRGGQADVAATLSSSASADVLHGHTGHAVEASPGNEGTGAGSSAIKSTLRSRLFGLRKAKVTNGVPQADTRAHLDDSGSPSSDMSASSSNRSTSKLAAAEALQIAVATTPEEEQNAEARAAPTYPPPPVPGMANSQSQPVQLANADHLSEGVQGPAANGLRSSTPQSGSALLHPFGAAASLARSESSSSRSRESIGAEIEGAVGADEAYSHISKRSLGKLQEHASYESDARPSEGLLSASHPSEGSSPATPFFPADSSFLRLQDRARAGREEESTASEATHAVSSAALAPAAVIRNEALDRTPRARERSGSMGDRGSPKPQLGGRRPGTAEGSPRSDARLRPQSMGASPMQSPISEDSLSETRLSRSNSKRHSRRESAGSYRSLAASIAAPLPRTSSLRNTQDVLSDTPGRPSLPRRSSSTTPTTPRSPLSATRTLDSPRTKLLQMQGSSSTLSLHEAEPSSPISPASTSPSTRPSKMPGAVAALAARFENAAALRPALNGRAQHSSAPPAQGQAHDPLASAGQAEPSLGASVSSIRARLGAFPTLGSRLGSGHHVNAPSPVPEEDSTSASHGLGSSQTSQDTPHLHSVLGHPLPLNQAETLEDQSSRTSISDSTAPASRLASPSIGAIESRRPALPQKNALRARAVAKSNQLGANAESGSAISAAGEPESNGCSAENAPLSPVRSSLETFAPTLDALGFSPRGEDVAFDHASASAVSVGSPASSQTGFPPWHQGVQLQPAPTPKKGGHRLSKQSPQLSVGSSVESPVGPPVPAKAAIDEPVELLDGLDTSSQPDLLEKHSQTSLTPGSQDGSSTSWRTLRKVSPSEVLGSKRKPGPSRPSSAHGESDSTVEVGTVSAKKKSSKRWPFSSKDSPDSAVTPDTISPGSFFGRSLRTRRPTEPSRPQIRRLFDSPQEEDGENGVIQAKTSMPLLRRRTSEGSEVSLGQFPSSATTDAQITHTMEQTSSAPLSPRDELSPELRRLLRRRNVISELVETEKSYASDLAVVRDIYLARARARCGVPSPSGVTPVQSPGSMFSTPVSASSSSVFLPQKPASSVASPAVGTQRVVSTSAGDAARASNYSHHSASTTGGATTNSRSSVHSSNPSHRSSVYTVSSQTSNTSDTHPPPPPLPATPPMLLGASAPPSVSSVATSGTSNALTKTGSSVTLMGSPSDTPPIPGRPAVSVLTGGPLSAASGSSFLSTSTVGAPDAPLSPIDIRIIFAHLEQCAAFADEMVAQLQGAKGTMAASASAPLAESEDVQDDRIGQFFLKMMPRIESIYSAYCSRHEASISRLQELTLSSSKASVFLKECTEAARVHTNAWDLASLLIKPVQRVLKYPLLIQQILTSTPASHPDEPNLRAALMEIQQVADNINEVKKRKDLVENILTGKSAPNMQRTASSTKRPKRKSDKAKHVLAGPSIEPITDDYVRLSAQLHTLRRNVHRFTRHCLDWSRAQKNAYESEIALTFQIGSVYRLGLDAAAIQEEAGAETPDTRQSAACEMLRGLVNGPWRQMDNDIRSTILPMTQRIEQMFENPIAVLAKRDERESDYQRYRAALAKSDKVPDKRLVDSANAFVALHAQLLDELPQFIYGVQTLLDIGVQAFARLQGTHHLQAKRARLAYWSEHAYASNELAIHPGTRELTLRHVQTVRVFWHAHEEAASFAETLVIANRDQVSLQEPAQPQDRFIIAAQADDSRQVTSYDPQLATSSRPSGPALLAPPGTSGRRPSGVAGLMRSLSGNFSREHSPTGEKVPPLPSGASALAAASRTAENHARVADQPPALSLTFKSGSSSRDSWFVLSGDANSLPFLSPPAEGGPQLEPYDLSPAQTTKPLPDEPKAADMPRSVEESRARPLPQNRHKMRVIALLTAQAESPLRDPAGRLGWPWLAFAPGDNIAVLSFDKSDEAVLAFGRGADGTLGWAERDLFVETRDSSSTTHDVEG